MKRNKYVDEEGNTIDYGFESKKPLLNLFFVIGTLLPLIIVGFIVYTVIMNMHCYNIYDDVKQAAKKYLTEENKLPEYEGDHIYVNVNDLYEYSYLRAGQTNNKLCNGRIKVTKYKDDYIYTLDLSNCASCTISKRYTSWSNETLSYMPNKQIIDVIPYYNLYEREVGVTSWSKLYDEDEIAKKKSKYGVRLPIEEDTLPEIPEGSNVAEVEKEDFTYYRHRDKSWKWYDIVGDYSDFYSEQPSGYSKRDDNTRKNTEYSEYSLNYPEEHDYRTIKKATGYKFYYVDENGEKVYANNGKYTVEDDVDLDVYTERDEETATMYSYSDKVWRWYNGEKRRYSSFRVSAPEGYNYKDEELYSLGNYSSWEEGSKMTAENSAYRVEESKIMSRYRYIYEILSMKVLDENLAKTDFETTISSSLEEIRQNEDYKLDIEYHFRYKNVR